MEFFASFPKRQHQHSELTGGCDSGLFEASPRREADSPGLQGRVSLHPIDQSAGCLVQKATHGGITAFGYPSGIINLT
jgi:hypothetical protein